MADSDGQSMRPAFPQYANDPVGFFRDVLAIDPWDRAPTMPPEHGTQVEILEAIRDHDKVAVRSGHKVSKSLSAAGISLWWIYTRTDGRVTLTAPASHQVESILWPEVRLLHKGEHPGRRRGAPRRELPGVLHLDCRAGLVLRDGWGVWGLTTDTPERMSGKSGSRQLFIVDEASGYPEEIFTSVFGNLAGGGKVLFISNPTRTSGTFFDVFHGKGSGWKLIWISSTSTPNFHGGRVDGLATPEWDQWAREHWGGPGAPLYDVRVLGKFPSQADNAVIALDLVEVAISRWQQEQSNKSVLVRGSEGDLYTVEFVDDRWMCTCKDFQFRGHERPCKHIAEALRGADAEGELDLGVDVAREGDDESILCAVRGSRCIEIEAVQLDRSPEAIPLGHQVGESAARMARRLARPSDHFRPRIKIDVVGVGSSVVDYLLEHYRDEFEIIGVNVGASADPTLVVVPSTDGKPALTAKDVYRNLRAQVWFGVRDWLKAGGQIPPDEKLRGELVAPTFRFIERGRIAVQEKSELKKTLRRSPDRADALGLAVYDPPGEPESAIGVTVIG